MSDDIQDQRNHEDDEGSAEVAAEGASIETALVEVLPGQALVFGKVPEGLDLVPLRLIPQADQLAISNAVAASSSILNIGSHAASGLSQAQGLVRLAPETLKALQSGAEPIKSGGYYLGTLRVGNQFSNSVRWLPASGATAVGVLASVGPAVAMMTIQMQLHEVSGLVRENMALTESVLKSVRNEQWAELTGLEKAITKALGEGVQVGEITPLLWANVAGYEAALEKQRDLFRRNVHTHAAEIAKRTGHRERRQYIEKNGEALILDLYSLILAHKAWFEYQAIRAGRARLEASSDPSEAKLLDTITQNAQAEYDEVVNEMAMVIDSLHRELAILAGLPGKRTLPFTGARRNANDVAKMSHQLLCSVEVAAGSMRLEPPPIQRHDVLAVDEQKHLERDLHILRWHLATDEQLLAISTASRPRNGAIERLGSTVGRRMSSVAAAAEATLRRTDILEAAELRYEQGDELLAVTSERVLVASVHEFRSQGHFLGSIHNDEIRYVRFREEAPNERAEVDLITKDDNFTWRFTKGSPSVEGAKKIAALLAERMEIPEADRLAFRSASAPWAPNSTPSESGALSEG